MTGNHDYETGNATVNAMLRSRHVRVSVDTSYAEQTLRLEPADALTTAQHIRGLEDAFLDLTAPEAVADALEHEVERLKAEVGSDG